MQPLRDFEIGAMFWMGRESLAELQALGLRCGQLGAAGGADLSDAVAAQWKRDAAAAQFTLLSVVAAYDGEDYADIPTVQRTVGFIPAAKREARERRTYAVSDFAARLGVNAIGTHIGFVPENPNDPDYKAVRDLVRRICDYAAANHQVFALETGQEPAGVLMRFIGDVDRDNLKINFDPANMILYGTGDPVEALRAVASRVVSVHCKDGEWPAPGVTGALGTERALGHGAVGIDNFVRTLAAVGYRGPLCIEREGTSHEGWLHDVRAAAQLLQQTTAKLVK